jgi:hypothetical protein
MTTGLTKGETSTLKWLRRAWWPKFALWLIIALTLCGLTLWGLSIGDIVLLNRDDLTTRDALVQTLTRGLIRVGFGGMLLVSAVWAGMLRHCGLLLRKIAGADEK